MPYQAFRFQNGSRLLDNGKWVGTILFVEADGKERIRPLTYPEQFKTAQEATAHAYREAIKGRAFPIAAEFHNITQPSFAPRSSP